MKIIKQSWFIDIFGGIFTSSFYILQLLSKFYRITYGTCVIDVQIRATLVASHHNTSMIQHFETLLYKSTVKEQKPSQFWSSDKSNTTENKL